MKIKPNYILIPLATVLIATVGSLFTDASGTWYTETLIKPDLTPPNQVFPLAWTTIYICTTISALLIYNKGQNDKRFLWFFKRENMSDEYWRILALFIVNAILNVSWSYIFFQKQDVEAAFYNLILLELTNILLLFFTFKKDRRAALLLIPYALWVLFAGYLNWQILLLN